jgi:starch synthase (maltosyl-transferring)
MRATLGNHRRLSDFDSGIAIRTLVGNFGAASERMGPFIMTPAAGERLLRFVGDRVRFTLRPVEGRAFPPGWRVFLRTNLGRGRALRQEIISAYPHRPMLANAAWHDVPLAECGEEWAREMTLVETGYYRAKPYALDPQGRQHWSQGDDIGISVHPSQYRTGNTIYGAFIRLFGETKHLSETPEPAADPGVAALDARGWTVIPSSGKMRDLIRELPFIVNTLGCRILHLLPVNPTPTVFARFGRFGSPYASQDLTAVDPALMEFDRRTTGIDQFRELTYAAHARGARVFIDIVINHTGWGARLQETHPEWYLRDDRGQFVSPGAWGTVWEDLAELDHRNAALWAELAEIFLVWCRRGVDGFRCDAGYKVPLRAWRYITARVLEEFPDTIFLLEGLGGSWEATELLLTEGSMQWAYSELFQNYSGIEVASYLEYALCQSQRVGLYVHYSETHDNNRLAARGRNWSLLRNRLCALTSVSGGFGFTCGVEWLASQKINVHQAAGLAWGREPNIVQELASLNELLRSHPCFFDGAKLTRISPPDSPVFALLRESADQSSRVLVVVNTNMDRAEFARFDASLFALHDAPAALFDPQRVTDVLGQSLPPIEFSNGKLEMGIPPAAAFCLEAQTRPGHPGSPDAGQAGEPRAKFAVAAECFSTGLFYTRARSQAAWAIAAAGRILSPEQIGAFDWRVLADWVERDPASVLGALLRLDRGAVEADFLGALFKAMGAGCYQPVVAWHLLDRRRITMVPPGHWLMIQEPVPFRAALRTGDVLEHVESIPVRAGHVACYAPRSPEMSTNSALELERYDNGEPRVSAAILFLAPAEAAVRDIEGTEHSRPTIALLTNGRGAMARLPVDFGQVTSKYDCLLGANLHPDLPVDRHVLAKRARLWVVANGFVTPLNASNLLSFKAGPPARWVFVAGAGDGRAAEIHVTAEMVPGCNTTVLRFHRPNTPLPFGSDLPAEAHVSVTVRVDIEDRTFHAETQRNSGADHHFTNNTRTIPPADNGRPPGFEFTPAPERRLRVVSDRGWYLEGGEWSMGIPHPVEARRGQGAAGDAWSPGWFELPLSRGETALLIATAEPEGDVAPQLDATFSLEREPATPDPFRDALLRAIKAFVVRRGTGRTIIAGYPWFLDWGRDSLICARGMIAAGMLNDVRDLLVTFARFEADGTLPNTIHGDNATNRDTSDAPLWFGIACEELALAEVHAGKRPAIYDADANGRPVSEVLRSIAAGYIRGTPNGIRMDPASALVWSPGHFTWMDTNYPAGTPREGYPIEIQALWIRLLRQLDTLRIAPVTAPWTELAGRALESVEQRFWREEKGWFCDVLHARTGVPASAAVADTSLRSNCLFPIGLGLFTGDRARRCVEAAARYLVVPGALRSLAPLPVDPPLPIHGPDGRLLNDPVNPYWGRYEGDEDTRRKPAYHNGTAWAWTFPGFCEAFARAWKFEPDAVNTAMACLLSMRDLMHVGCAGHIAEVFDGDAPHEARGCDAQAWSVTEALRVLDLLRRA